MYPLIIKLSCISLNLTHFSLFADSQNDIMLFVLKFHQVILCRLSFYGFLKNAYNFHLLLLFILPFAIFTVLFGGCYFHFWLFFPQSSYSAKFFQHEIWNWEFNIYLQCLFAFIFLLMKHIAKNVIKTFSLIMTHLASPNENEVWLWSCWTCNH